MREDTFTRDEQGAAEHAAILGASEHIGSDVGDQTADVTLPLKLGPDPWGMPNPKPTLPPECFTDPPF